MTISSVTSENFDQIVLNNPLPVIVDFWAEWCGPCKALKPILEQVAEEKAGQVEIVQVNTEECMDLATEYSVRGLPTLILFSGGQKVDQKVGASPKSVITKWIDQALGA